MKKFMILLLALAMSTFIFTGCGNSNGNTSQTEEPAADETKDAAEEEHAADVESEEAKAAEEESTAVDLTILYEEDDSMINNYSLLAVNPDAPFVDANGESVSDVAINTAGAKALTDWMLSEEAKTAAADFGFEEYGEHLFYAIEDGPSSEAEIPAATEETKTIRISTTTSVNDSGLLAYLLPMFEESYGYTVEVFSAGTGKAIANAQFGNADLIMVHSQSQENEFVDAGFSMVLDGYESERLTFLYNYFVLCGPSSDPAQVASAPSVRDAFQLIADGSYPFISRGDESGTHTMEVSLWPEELGITTDAASVKSAADWYIFSNSGMGTCLTMAEEKGAYILSDKATFLTFKANNGVME
jgi:ABC-type tungstate transport system permease subunit